MSPTPSLEDTPVWDLVRGNEHRGAVLSRFGIDYCCGGKMSLGEVCASRGLLVDDVLRALRDDDDAHAAADAIDWTRESLARLADHIVTRHHAYLRDMLPRLGSLLDQVLSKHVDNHPNLAELRSVYSSMWNELVNHMMKEEVVLFPFIQAMEEAQRAGKHAPQFHCGSVLAPIHVMEDEHCDTAVALCRMRELTSGFRPPKDACNAYRVLMAGLRELEGDLHLHIHKENNILFPRAAQLEALLQEGAAAPLETA